MIGPLGEVIAGPVYDRAAILAADLDLDEIARGKFDFDVVGHYAVGLTSSGWWSTSRQPRRWCDQPAAN